MERDAWEKINVNGYDAVIFCSGFVIIMQPI